MIPRVSAGTDQIVEVLSCLSAAEESKRRNGVSVTLPEVIEAARESLNQSPRR